MLLFILSDFFYLVQYRLCQMEGLKQEKKISEALELPTGSGLLEYILVRIGIR